MLRRLPNAPETGSLGASYTCAKWGNSAVRRHHGWAASFGKTWYFGDDRNNTFISEIHRELENHRNFWMAVAPRYVSPKQSILVILDGLGIQPESVGIRSGWKADDLFGVVPAYDTPRFAA